MKPDTMKRIKTLAVVQEEIETLRANIRTANRRIIQLEECKARETCEGCQLRCKT